jgi:hypothetical protein
VLRGLIVTMFSVCAMWGSIYDDTLLTWNCIRFNVSHDTTCEYLLSDEHDNIIDRGHETLWEKYSIYTIGIIVILITKLLSLEEGHKGIRPKNDVVWFG